MITHFVVNCILIKNNKVLLEISPNDTYWKLPGGHIDSNETLIEAIERECREEMGITINMLSQSNVFTTNSIAQSLPVPLNTYLYDVKPDSHFNGSHRHMGFVYVAEPLEDVKNLEQQQLRWFSADSLNEQDINPVVKALCLEALKNFSTAV